MMSCFTESVPLHRTEARKYESPPCPGGKVVQTPLPLHLTGTRCAITRMFDPFPENEDAGRLIANLGNDGQEEATFHFGRAIFGSRLQRERIEAQ